MFEKLKQLFAYRPSTRLDNKTRLMLSQFYWINLYFLKYKFILIEFAPLKKLKWSERNYYELKLFNMWGYLGPALPCPKL